MKWKHIYLAGIIDGGGTITINRHSRDSKGQWHLKPLLRVSDRNKELVDYLVRNFGGSCIECRQKGHKTIYKWSVHGIKPINEILRHICPRLIVKVQQANVLIAFTNSRRKAISADHRSPYSEADVGYYSIIRRLNVRRCQ